MNNENVKEILDKITDLVSKLSEHLYNNIDDSYDCGYVQMFCECVNDMIVNIYHQRQLDKIKKKERKLIFPMEFEKIADIDMGE